MPPALDLTGRRFGRLQVIKSAGWIQFGRQQRAWKCVCDCGRLEIFPTDKLTKRGYIECAACRQPCCVVCGAKVPPERGRKNTCSDQCQQAKTRATQLEHYYRRVLLDPEINRRRHAQQAAKLAQDPARQAAHAQRERARSKARWEEAKRDPALQQANRERRAAWYAAHAADVQEKRKARIQNMGPEEFERWAERSRAYQRAYAKRWRAELRDNPAAHQKFLDAQRTYMREWKRRRALARLAATGEEIMKRNA